MKSYTYRVYIPEFISQRIALATSDFTNENIFTARKQALKYLSDAIKKSFDEKLISIFDFTDENSTELTQIEDLTIEKFFINENLLNFEYLSEYKIIYNYSEAVIKEAIKHQCKDRISIKNALVSFAIFKLFLKEENTDFETVFEFTNNEKIDNNKLEETIIYFLPEEEQTEKLFPLVSKFYFELKMTHREFKIVYLKKGNDIEKEIYKTRSFFELEKVFLSICNYQYMMFLFVDEEHAPMLNKALKVLKRTYRARRPFQITKNVMLNNRKVSVFFFDFHPIVTLTYSKNGKLFLRSDSGFFEVTENTNTEEVFMQKSCNNAHLERILKFI